MNTAQLFAEVGLNPADYDDLHITRMMHGFVAVSHGEIIKVTEPRLRYCPLVAYLYNRPGGSDDVEAVKQMMIENTREKIARFGHFTERREIQRGDIAVPYGASEMIMFAMRKGHFDCAVTVCDGAGTVLCDQPDLVQGIGARMNGTFYTTPIPAVISRLEEHGCHVPFPDTAEINQVGGLRRAAELGYKRIAVLTWMMLALPTISRTPADVQLQMMSAWSRISTMRSRAAPVVQTMMIVAAMPSSASAARASARPSPR